MKNKIVFLSAVLWLWLGAGTALGAISAPTVVKQGYGLGAELRQGGDSVPNSWNKVHFVFSFMYEGDTSSLKAFRLYEKRPGAYGSSLAVEFSNLLDVTSSHSAVSGTWSIARLNTTWIISKRDQSLLTTEPVALYESVEASTAYPLGTYGYYVTAVDSGGYESAPSQTFNLHVIGPIKIFEPAQGSTVALTPNIRWTADLPWPDNQAVYLISIHDGTKTLWTKTVINKTGELAYDGAPLDQAKKNTLHIHGWWTSGWLKPLDSYFAGTSKDSTFQVSATPPPPPPVACAQDAQLCPDGSYVGRVAPSCEFKPCPTVPPPPTPIPVPPPPQQPSITTPPPTPEPIVQPIPPPTPKPIPSPSSAPKQAPAPVVKPVPTPFPKTGSPKEEKQIEKLPLQPVEEKMESPENVPLRPRGIFRRFIDSVKTIWRGLFSSAPGTKRSEQ